MRKMLLVLSLLVLIMLGFSNIAIHGQGQELPVPREETVIIETHEPFTNFDKFNPFIPFQFSSGFIQWGTEYLYYANYATGKIIKWLSTGWNYSEDFKTLTIYIRKGVKWQDGKPFTSHDVAFTINMLKKYAPKLTYSPEIAEFVESVETPDDLTVIIHLKKPNPRFHRIFMCQICTGLIIVPKHIWEGKDPLTFANYPPITTAPYKLKEVNPDLKMFVWERWEDYWGKEIGYFPRPKYIIVRQSTSPDISAERCIRNEIDHFNVGPMHDLYLKCVHENPDISIPIFYDPCPFGVAFNTKKYPLSLKEVRWAIAYCIDYNKIARLWKPKTTPARGPFPEYETLKLERFEDIFNKYRLEYNIEKAKAILDKLGFIDRDGDGIRETPNGTKLSFTWLVYKPPGYWHYAAGEVISEGAKKAGIEIIVKYVPWASYYETAWSGHFDTCITWFCGATLDTIGLFKYYHSRYYRPIGEMGVHPAIERWTNKTFDKLVEEAESLPPDDPKLTSIERRLLEIWMAELPSVPLIQTIYGFPCNSAYWKGWPTSDNMYTVPFHWWGQFLFVFFNLRKGSLGVERELTKRISELEEALKGKVVAIETLKESMKKLSEITRELDKEVGGLTENVTKLTERIEILESSLRELRSYFMASIGISIIAIVVAIALPLIISKRRGST